METAKIYLCKADCSMLGTITGLKPETCSLEKNATDLWEFSFEVNRYINDNGTLIQSNYYDSIDEMMKIYFDSNDEQLFFVIDSEPEIHGEGIQEIKTAIAHSIEVELSHIFLKNFKINCGTDDSQEYLATDSDGNFNNINPYTRLPYEYISLVNYENTQLSLLHLILEGTGWTVKPNIVPEICSIKRSYDIQSNNIYAFLMNTVSPTASVIFEFDRKHRQIGAVKIEDYGEDTGIFISMRNLMHSFDISSSSDDNIKTKIIPSGANDLGIEQVNFGKDFIINLDYFMNTINEYGDYKYVSKELHDKYNLWKNYRETDQVIFNGRLYTRRELYIELTKLYNQTILDINNLKNRVPNDGALTDYKTFSLEELKLHLNAFNKALISLITLYKNEYGVTEVGNAPNYMPVPSSATNIKDTVYWHDFYAYKESIVPQIEEALKMYCQTDSNGNLMFDEDGHFIELEFGNPAYYTDPSIVKEIDSYKYEWSLYGLDELESKKKAWLEVSNLLFNECFITSGTIADPTAYRTPDDTGWNSLSEIQKKDFTSKNAYIDKLNQYLDYMSFDIRDNSLTKTKCKGIIRQCDDAIINLRAEISTHEQLLNSYSTQRRELSNSVMFENFKKDDVFVFTDKDLNVIKGLMREYEYNNDNILVTNLDDIVSSITAQEELYRHATEELYKLSQPQYSFSTNLDNIYALDEFKSYHKPFIIGNFIRVGLEMYEELFDINFIKLRVISITYNPVLADENLSVEFSTMTKSLSGMNDIDFFLNNSSSSSNSSSNSSSSSSSGTYGNNDANVQMSNNMLNALLSTELFGTTVTDVILDSIKANKGNFNTLLSHSGVFDSLEAGQIKVSGECLFDMIKSSNYIDGKSGSMLSLTDGSFSFAAGALTYTPQSGLIIKGVASDESLQGIQTALDGLSTGITSINGACINTGSIISNNYNGTKSKPLENTQGSIIQLLDGSFNLGGGSLKWDGTNLIINGNGEFSGNITATTLTANKSGTIAGWTFDTNGFYKGENSFSTRDGMYLGNDGFSINDYFSVDNEGFILKDKNYIKNEDKTTFISLNQIRLSKPTMLFPMLSNQIVLYIDDEDCTVNSLDCILNYDENGMSGNNVNLHFDVSYTISELAYLYNNNKTADIVRLYITASKCYAKKIFVYKLDNFLNFNETDYYILNRITAGYNLIGASVVYSNAYHNYMVNVFNKQKIGMSINSNAKAITIDDVDITNTSIIGRNNYSIQFGGNLGAESSNCPYSNISYDENYESTSTTIIDFDGIRAANNDESYYDFYFSRFYGIKSPATYENKVSGKSLYISSDGTIGLSSSSKRFKNSISIDLTEISDPHGLYDIDIVQYKYNNDYFSSKTDEGIGKYFIGFIAEDIAEKFKDGATFDKDNLPDGWDIRYMFPAALKLIQEQHKEIETMKQQFQELKVCIIN